MCPTENFVNQTNYNFYERNVELVYSVNIAKENSNDLKFYNILIVVYENTSDPQNS